MYVCNVCMYVCMSCMYVCTCMYVHVCTNCTCTCMYVYVYVLFIHIQPKLLNSFSLASNSLLYTAVNVNIHLDIVN